MKYRTKSKAAQACEIPPDVKEAVWERDHHRCVLCGTTYTASPCAHYIPRSHLGLGIEENIVTLCMSCHCDYDNSPMRGYYKDQIRRYLKMRYPDWDERKLVYRKYGDIEDYYNTLPPQKQEIIRDYIDELLKKEKEHEQDHLDRESDI